MIPGLENAEFVRCGVMHQLLYGLSKSAGTDFRSKKQPNLFFAGQMTGVEGYVKLNSFRFGCYGIQCARLFNGEEALVSKLTAIGSLPHYITHADSKHFQPMNVNLALSKELEGRGSVTERAMRRLLSAPCRFCLLILINEV